MFNGFYSAKNYPEHLRRIRFKDLESGKTLVFLTNNTSLPALTIADLYKHRWQVETFGVNGRYVSSDDRRPFQMLGADGDAYTVLEILLGDLACAEDGASGRGAHPGLLILDCPREREMSSHLYDRFLTLVDEVCKAAPGLQVILTTTTSPPGLLREPPTCILKLSRASDDDLLLKRRVENLLARATLSSHAVDQ